MPQDTTIYWDGYDTIPAPIDSLPLEQKILVLQKIEDRKQELEAVDPMWIYVSIVIFAIVFIVVALSGKNKKSA